MGRNQVTFHMCTLGGFAF